MALSEIWILTDVGQPVVLKKYRNDIRLNSAEEFSQIISKSSKDLLQPHSLVKGIHLFNIKRQGLYFLAVSSAEICNVFVIEFLSRLYQICKDFCGTVNEDNVRKNFVLIQEILDEILDYGFVQLCSTDKLKPYIQSVPVVPRTADKLTTGLFGVEHRVTPGQASDKSVIKSKTDQDERKDELFIDFIERMAVVIDSKGMPQRCEIQGTMNMKAFLNTAHQVQLTFNEGLILGKEAVKSYGKQIYIEDYKFHQCVNTTELETFNIIKVQPPQGEFSVMTYRLQGDLAYGLPLRLHSYINSNLDSRDLEVGLKLKCEILPSSQAVNVKLLLPLPKSVTSISQQLGELEQTAEFVRKENTLQWFIKKIPGKTEVTAHFKLIEGNLNPDTCLMELGPINLDFEISGYLCSNLHIKHLKVEDRDRSYVPARWVRYITTPDSYVIKMH